MTADELWEKSHQVNHKYGFEYVSKADFFRCMTEYGEHIKAEAVKVCRDNIDMYSGNTPCANYCAAAIERMEIK